MIEAPWTAEQVDTINRWQQTDHFHGLTCPNHHKASRLLVANTDGLSCPGCFYKQNWVPDFLMAEPPPWPFDRPAS